MAANEEWHGYVITFPTDLKVRHLTILFSCYLQTINLIKHQQRLTENLEFKICIMILESLFQAI